MSDQQTSQSSAIPTLGLPADLSLDDESILARTIWGEARGEDTQGRKMIANAVVNRVAISAAGANPHWWGRTVTDVCLHPFQFDCWLPHDPNRPKLLAVTEDDPIYAECVQIARDAIAGNQPDLTNGATSYLNPVAVMASSGKLPLWATPANQTAQHLRHTFYRVM